jgi:membrane protease YdiL (CAAX protease family)
MVLSLKIASSGSKELQELSQGMLADIGGKLFAGGLMVYLLRKYVPQDLLFEGRKTGDESLLRRLPLWSRTLLMVGAIYLAIFPLVNDLLLRLGIFLVERVLHISVPEGHQVFELLDDPSSLFTVKVGTLLLAAIISPIVEELFFRGLLQNVLYKALHRPWPAIAITAILFMFVHAPMYQQMPSLGVLGLILGWSYYRYRSLAVPVLTHIVFNSVTLIFWALGGGE